MSTLEVIAPGFLTTVQDLGRPGHAEAGVSASGAGDPIALRIGNRLVGNPASAPALEMTMVGGRFRFASEGIIALAGADPAAQLSGRRAEPWRPIAVHTGETLECTQLTGGLRTYLCVRGGFEVSSFLGSASTHLLTRLGGYEGRALAAGDRIPLGAGPPGEPHGSSVDPSVVPGYRRGEAFRVTEGPQSAWFDESACHLFYETTWRVAGASDRMGIRLDGPAISQSASRELVSEGVCLGAIQIPTGGTPIVLFVEHQTTGGYPKIANVIAADLARLGGLAPGESVRFTRVSVADAHALLAAQEDALHALFS